MARENDSPQNKQTPSSKSSFSDAQLLDEAREAYHIAETNHQVALKKIQELCEKHSNSGILIGARAQILDICCDNTISSDEKTTYLKHALYWARRSKEFDPNSIVFSGFLAYMLLKTSTSADNLVEAFQEFSTSLNISHPTDPLQESPQSIFADTYEERIDDIRKEILQYLEVCVYYLKQQGVDSSIVKLKLQSLNVEIKDKVKLYWISLNVKEKLDILIVDVGHLKSSLVSSMKHLEEKVLSEALSFYEAHKKWEFWKCCRCEESFPNSSLYFIHIATTHLEGLLSKLSRAYPVRVSDWVASINTIEWMPFDASAASRMLKMNQELLSSKVTELLKEIKWRSLDASAASTMHKMNRELLSSEATSELLKDKYDVNRDIHKWEWPLSTDPNCMNLLSMIQKSLKELLSNNCLLVTHMDILRQQALSKLDDLFRELLIEFGFDRTHHCLCFLDASQLQEIFSLLQEMSIFTGKRSIMEDDSWAFKINGKISLSSDSLNLCLDETALHSDSIPASSDSPKGSNLISWIYSGHSHDQHLEKWRTLRAEKENHGKEELVKYEKHLSESLRDLHEFQEGVSVAVIPTVVSNLKVGEVMGFSLQKPRVGTSTQAMIDKKSENNDSKLSKSDKQILQFSMDMQQLEIILNCSAAHSYQPIVLSIVKQYIRERMEGIMDKDNKKTSDASSGKDLGAEEERHPLEMKESSGASFGKDLGTEEVRHPLEMKESIMDPQVGYGDIRSTRRTLDAEGFDLADVDEATRRSLADQRSKLIRRT